MKRKTLETIAVNLFYISVLCLLTQCHHTNPQIQTSESAIQSYGEIIRKEQGWTLAGTGGSFYDPNNIVLSMHFDARGVFSLPIARKRLINTAEEFLQHLKNNKSYELIFKGSEISVKNIHITIAFLNEHEKLADDGHVACVVLKDGKIIYGFVSKESPGLKWRKEEIESYEQARAIVSEDKLPSTVFIGSRLFAPKIEPNFERTCQIMIFDALAAEN